MRRSNRFRPSPNQSLFFRWAVPFRCWVDCRETEAKTGTQTAKDGPCNRRNEGMVGDAAAGDREMAQSGREADVWHALLLPRRKCFWRAAGDALHRQRQFVHVQD